MEITCLEYVRGLLDLLESKSTPFSKEVVKNLGIGQHPQLLAIELADDLIKIRCKNTRPESIFKKLLGIYKCKEYEITFYVFGKGKREISKKVTIDVNPIVLKNELLFPEEELKEEKIKTKFFELHSRGEELILKLRDRSEVKAVFLRLAKELFPFLRIPTFANSIRANILIEIKNEINGLKEGEIKFAVKLNNNPFGIKVANFRIQT